MYYIMLSALRVLVALLTLFVPLVISILCELQLLPLLLALHACLVSLVPLIYLKDFLNLDRISSGYPYQFLIHITTSLNKNSGNKDMSIENERTIYVLGSRFASPPPQWYPSPPPPTPHASKVPTVTGIEPLGVAIRRFRRLKAAILVTVVSFYSSHVRYVAKVPTVTGIRVVLIAVLTNVIAFETSYRCRSLNMFTITGFVLISIFLQAIPLL